MKKNYLLTSLLLLFVTSMLWTPSILGKSFQKNIEPKKLIGLDSPDRIKGEYIVVLKQNTGASFRHVNNYISSDMLVQQYGVEIMHEFQYLYHGFAVRMTEDQAREISQRSDVEYVRANQTIQLSAPASSSSVARGQGIDQITALDNWGLDRIDQRALPLDSQPYQPPYTGKGVHVYVLDTGVSRNHEQFAEEQVIHEYDAVNNVAGGVQHIHHSHGTGVASIIAGNTLGVAPGVTIHSIKVGDGPTTSLTTMYGGLNWVAGHHVKPAIINLGYVLSEYELVNNIIQQHGIHHPTPVGNNDESECKYAGTYSSRKFLTVGSSNIFDSRAGTSNLGECVDIYAPGKAIKMAFADDNTSAYTYGSTPVISAAFVSGAMALYLEQNPNATYETVRKKILSTSTKNILTNLDSNSLNRLLYVGDGFFVPEAPAVEHQYVGCKNSQPNYRVSWSLLFQGNETLQYQVDRRTSDRNGKLSDWEHYYEGENTEIIYFDYSDPFFPSKLRVRAKNQYGWGEYRIIDIDRKHNGCSGTDPKPAIQYLQSSFIQCRFNEQPEFIVQWGDNLNNTIEYDVDYRTQYSGWSKWHSVYDGSMNYTKITVPNNHYSQIRVRGKNWVGYGDFGTITLDKIHCGHVSNPAD